MKTKTHILLFAVLPLFVTSSLVQAELEEGNGVGSPSITGSAELSSNNSAATSMSSVPPSETANGNQYSSIDTEKQAASREASEGRGSGARGAYRPKSGTRSRM